MPTDATWPLVVGHRGASADYPENTLPSFEGAIRAGADVVELDVRLTADRVPVIMHDADVSETTDGAGFVNDLMLADIRRLHVRGAPAAESGRAEVAPVPTFREALELLSGRVGVDVEIKNLPGEPGFDSPREEVVERVVEALAESRFRGDVIISSFNWLSIERARQLRPDIATGFLSTASVDPWASLVYVKSAGHEYVLPQFPVLLEVGEPFVQAAHSDGIGVGTWTADDPELIERLFALGIDAVATNRPDVAVPIRDRFRS
jgi:glycerophosphoryl diester phosphodiesterase